MSGHRPWSDVKAEKARRDAARGRVPRRSLVTSTSFTTETSSSRSHTRAEFGLLIHPDVDVDAVKLRLIQEVMKLNAELNDEADREVEPEYFIHTRGPHEGQRVIPEHVCVPECYEDQSAAFENAVYVDPRPRYRVLAWPWYDHKGDESPYHPAGDGHDANCAAGYELEIWRRNPDQLGPLGEWTRVGVTQTDSGGTLNHDEVVDLVLDFVMTLASPLPIRVDADQVTVFAEVSSV